jgi:SAM-dependent methyltransferase
MQTWECSDQQSFIFQIPKIQESIHRDLEYFIAAENNLLEEYFLPGYCIPCGRATRFLVDRKWGGVCVDGLWQPNWRERLECAWCGFNNRQRVIAGLVSAFLKKNQNAAIYLMEQVTPIFHWVQKKFPTAEVIGSEYLGSDISSGVVKNGLLHQDIEKMSFSDGQFDLIVSNDVLEHVANPGNAFSEMVRVLKKGGEVFMTIPFYSSIAKNVSRSKVTNGKIEHLLEPQYHGNPVSSDGSLVFTDFGWEMLSQLRSVGFSEVKAHFYWSFECGHLGGEGQNYFHMVK